MPMDEAKMTEIVEAAMDRKFNQFFVDPEKHYQQHLWLDGLIQWSDRAKTSAAKTLINCLIVGALGLLVLGFTFWGNGGGH